MLQINPVLCPMEKPQIKALPAWLPRFSTERYDPWNAARAMVPLRGLTSSNDPDSRPRMEAF